MRNQIQVLHSPAGAAVAATARPTVAATTAAVGIVATTAAAAVAVVGRGSGVCVHVCVWTTQPKSARVTTGEAARLSSAHVQQLGSPVYTADMGRTRTRHHRTLADHHRSCCPAPIHQ
jgi:hypothetical protein